MAQPFKIGDRITYCNIMSPFSLKSGKVVAYVACVPFDMVGVAFDGYSELWDVTWVKAADCTLESATPSGVGVPLITLEDIYPPGSEIGKGCSRHTWRRYVGLIDAYDYCETCDEKRY